MKRDRKIRPDAARTQKQANKETNNQNKMRGLMRVRNILLLLVEFYVLYVFNFIFHFTVSFAEMHGLPLILVCGLFHLVTLSDMPEAMGGELLCPVPSSGPEINSQLESKVFLLEFIRPVAPSAWLLGRPAGVY